MSPEYAKLPAMASNILAINLTHLKYYSILSFVYIINKILNNIVLEMCYMNLCKTSSPRSCSPISPPS